MASDSWRSFWRRSNACRAWRRVLKVTFSVALGLLVSREVQRIGRGHGGDDRAGGRILEKGARGVPRDKELSKLFPENKTGSRFVDKLMEVRPRGGDSALVMVHIEVQSSRDDGFSQRMFTYYYRLRDRYEQEIVSLALLADADTAWRPQVFTTERWGCKLKFVFPIVKLLDFHGRENELAASHNPFALIVSAILKVQETASGEEGATRERRRWKLHTMRSLCERAYSREHMHNLFKFLDWAVRLPRHIEEQLYIELSKTEEGKR